MQIETKNYNDFYKKYDYTKVEEIVITSINLREQPPNFSSLINTLNTIPILTPTTTQKLIINFEDFTILNKIILNQKNYFKRKLNKWFKTDFSTNSDYAFYNKDNRIINIREELFTQQISNYNPTFSQILKNNISNSNFLNFVVLHEIGHAIQHQYYLGYQQLLSSQNVISDFINKTVSFHGYLDLSGNTENNYKFRNKDLSVMTYHAVTEGFADLYACIIISQVYPQKEATNLIQNIIKSRKEADKNDEFYQSIPSIEKYLNDYISNKAQWNNFNDIIHYISTTIEKTIKDITEIQLTKTTTPEIELNNRYLGLINKQLNLNLSHANEVIAILNSNYSFNINNIKLLDNDFKYGEVLYESNKFLINQNEELKKAHTNIHNLRTFFFKNKSNNNKHI